MPSSQDLDAILTDLVHANHILYARGVVDAFGHISARDPGRPDRFWISRTLAPALVTREDLLCLDLDGNTVGDERRSYLERFIHAEIYRARPDVLSVLHNHSPSVVPFGITGVPFRPVCHMCGFLTARTPVFEIRECAGIGSDILVRDSRLGAALARTMGGEDVALMRGHGVTIAAGSVRQAVFRGVYTELNAKLLLQSLTLTKEVNYLTEEEARTADASIMSSLDRAWDLWVSEASPG